MPVKLNATGGGSVSINPPATTSNFTATMPAATGNVVLDSAAQTLTNKSWSSPAGSTVSSGTAVASTSGTTIDFTGIPSWVKRITVMFTGVSTNGTTEMNIQLGTGATPTYTTSGYIGTCAAAGSSGTAMSTGFLIGNTAAAAQIYSGQVIISNFSGNTWVESSMLSPSAAAQSGPRYGSGYVPLAAALTAIRITAGGTDTFDAGSINILYE